MNHFTSQLSIECTMFMLILLGVIGTMTVQSVPIASDSGAVSSSPIINDHSKVLRLLQPRHKIDKRSITAFVTDPALLVTILHSLEVAYWTMPFGFLLQPIINLFRMPNRRSDSAGISVNTDAKVRELYRNLIRSIHKFEMLENMKKVSN